MIDRSIAGIMRMFSLLFVLLLARQAWLVVVEGPHLDADPHNPRAHTTAAGRGAILASDGTPLAASRGESRVYPFGPVLAQTIGYASARYGASGLEGAYDRILEPPQQSGDVMAEIAQVFDLLRGRSRALRGSDIVTTLEPRIQNALFGALARYPRAAGVVLDPRSGAVLAMASVPSYDPNTLDRSWSALGADAQSPLLNRATEGLYPPGSTFKVFTASTALDAGVVTPASTFSDPGYFAVGNAVIHDDEGEATGVEDLAGAFARSSNVDFAQIALAIGVPRFYDYLDRWKFGQTMHFQLPIQYDRFSPQGQVYDGILAQMGFGQADVLVTPLQMALVAATIADGGIEPRPYIERGVAGPEGISSATRPGELAEPISADTAAEMKNLMVGVVTRGTGTAAAIAGVSVAGKTGTATNPSGRAHAWFIAFAPAEQPTIALAIVVENAGYGGAIAAPIARRVIQAALTK
mgnify:CR=1 FL=1